MRLRTPNDIGALIRQKRRAIGLNQERLANLVGVSRLWITQIERGKPGASLHLVLKTLAAIGVTLTTADQQDTVRSPLPVTSPDINAIVDNARKKTDP